VQIPKKLTCPRNENAIALSLLSCREYSIRFNVTFKFKTLPAGSMHHTWITLVGVYDCNISSLLYILGNHWKKGEC